MVTGPTQHPGVSHPLQVKSGNAALKQGGFEEQDAEHSWHRCWFWNIGVAGKNLFAEYGDPSYLLSYLIKHLKPLFSLEVWNMVRQPQAVNTSCYLQKHLTAPIFLMA